MLFGDIRQRFVKGTPIDIERNRNFKYQQNFFNPVKSVLINRTEVVNIDFSLEENSCKCKKQPFAVFTINCYDKWFSVRMENLTSW